MMTLNVKALLRCCQTNNSSNLFFFSGTPRRIIKYRVLWEYPACIYVITKKLVSSYRQAQNWRRTIESKSRWRPSATRWTSPKAKQCLKVSERQRALCSGFLSLAFRSHRLELVCGRRVRKKTKSVAVHLSDQRTDEPSEKQFQTRSGCSDRLKRIFTLKKMVAHGRQQHLINLFFRDCVLILNVDRKNQF